MEDRQATTRHGPIYLRHPEPHVPGYQLAEVASPPLGPIGLIVLAVLSALIALGGFQLHHWSSGATVPDIALPWVIPFVLLLGSIALMPFIHRHWWEHNYARVALILGLIVTLYYVLGFADGTSSRKAIASSLAEYISFIFLLGSLYIVSGGMLIRVRAKATPIANVATLLIGAILANFFGTTGASMLLIRPFLQMNKGHIRPYHVVFFIFIVSNLGGSLTPIGDPPLFLGYLQGVPFWWVFERCNLIWLFSNGLLLVIFFVIDRHHARRMQRDHAEDFGPAATLYGAVNLIFIAMIVGGILLHAPINHRLHALGFELPVRELLMLCAALGSLLATPHRVHAENKFGYGPIREVAFLFIGIFLTMTPALNYLHWQSSRSSPIQTPTQYYFATGTLSAFLDNAPTYLTFFETAVGQVNATNPATGSRAAPLLANPQGNQTLIAISMGAVLFGACTYIGNGPNFMVKAIAAHSGVPMPSFFGYVFRYTLPILLPVLVLVWIIFIA